MVVFPITEIHIFIHRAIWAFRFLDVIPNKEKKCGDSAWTLIIVEAAVSLILQVKIYKSDYIKGIKFGLVSFVDTEV